MFTSSFDSRTDTTPIIQFPVNNERRYLVEELE